MPSRIKPFQSTIIIDRDVNERRVKKNSIIKQAHVRTPPFLKETLNSAIYLNPYRISEIFMQKA